MSGDVMMFPDTVEEFMEQNKVVDREQVYSNGIEFVPIFRMQQWFDHVKHSPDDLRPVGKWIEREDMYWGWNIWECSACHEEFCIEEGTPKDNEYNYCPNCGAKMEVTNDA